MVALDGNRLVHGLPNGGMLHEAVDDPAGADADAVLAAYRRELSAAVDEGGADAVAEATPLDADTLAAVADGEAVELTLAQAAAILATSQEAPGSDVIVAEVRDHLMLGMTTGILDVDTVAAEIDADLTGKEVQQALEGRTPVTLSRLAALQSFIAAQQR